MTEQELGKVMKLLEKYYKNFYAGTDKREVFAAWYPLFKDDDPVAVEKAVVEVVCTLRFPPTVADIKLQLAEDRLEDQPTAIEAFEMISNAVNSARDRSAAAAAYNELPPLIRKLAGSPSRLASWHRISEEAFETVVMSEIRESYNAIAKREAKYYALPAGIRKASGWRIEGADAVALPEPAKERSIDQMWEDMEKDEKYYREKYGVGLNPGAGNADKLSSFMAPVTEKERKEYEARQKHAEEKRLEKMK